MNIFSNIKKDFIILGILLVISGLITMYAVHDAHKHHKSVMKQLMVQVIPPAVAPVPSQHEQDVKLHKQQIHNLCEILKTHNNLPSTTVHALANEIEVLEAIDAE